VLVNSRMTTANTTIDPLATGIGCSLEHEPELIFFQWKVQAQNLAASKATIVDASGLLTLVLDDVEWNQHTVNQIVAADGTVTIAPRPVEPVHVPITNGMTNAQISVAKYSNDRHLIWHEARTTLKVEIIRSLGPTLASTIGPPPMGFTTISVPQIVAAVKGFYGTVDQMALNKMEDILASPLDNVTNLDKHLANMRQHMLMQTTAGYPIEEHRKVRIFRKSVLGHHLIAGILADYDHENLDPLQHTYDLITAYVKKHLPNLRAAADMASSSGRALIATDATMVPHASLSATGQKPARDMGHAELLCAFSVLEHKHRNLQQNQKRSGKRAKAQGDGKGNKKAKEHQSTAPIRAEDCTSYCHAHGYQSSHTSALCKVMANQKQNFTAEMRKATGPNSPPGGSKLVRGREPTIMGHANMMSSFALNEAGEPVSLGEPVPDTIPSAAPVPPSPNTGFFDEEYSHGKRTGSPPTTERTNQDSDSAKRTNQDAALETIPTPPPPKRANTAGTLPTHADTRQTNPINRCEGLLLREGESFTRTSIDTDLETPEQCRQLSDRITHSLMFDNWKPDFKAQHIPSRQRDAVVHETLSRLLAARDKTEAELTELMTDEYPDGTLKVRDEDIVEKTYKLLSARCNNYNRAMFTIYAQFLIADLPPINTALSASVEESSSSEPLCPYSHIREHTPPPPTVPQFETIVLDDTTQHALLTQKMRPGVPDSTPNSVWAVADSGASHILIRKSDAHILTSIEYTPVSAPPIAVLKTANGDPLCAIGQGKFTVGSLSLTAYIFQPSDLVNNLLGLAPFADRACTSTFRPTSFQIYPHKGSTPLLVGTRDSSRSLWLVDLNANSLPISTSDGIPPPHQYAALHTSQMTPAHGVYIEANHVSRHDNASYVRFTHACLGYPAPTTFLRAVTAGYITGPNQFPRLTAKMVRKHLPNATATAKGHLDQTPSSLPHAQSDAVSALRRHHANLTKSPLSQKLSKSDQADTKPVFDPRDVPRSTVLHLDYTGALPEVCTSGTRYFQVSCWGGYINIQPLVSLRAEHTTVALRRTVEFFRNHNVNIQAVRMDNQQSQPLRDLASAMQLRWELVSPYIHNPNRAERAIRTAKNHIIATRAGFHPDCPHAYLDKCLVQIELTLNIIRPYDYDPSRSAYEGLTGCVYNFQQHPIAPVGAKVLTWDSPTHRGTWADHGVEAVYLGPAENHLRAFEVWVPNTSAPRVTNTVWWFLHDNMNADLPLLGAESHLAYPPSKTRPDPRDNGSDLVGRAFLEPELGVCLITGLGPVTHNQMPTRARRQRNRASGEPTIAAGSHFTLTYKQTTTGEENYSSLTEILHWIETGPLLQPPAVPVPTNQTDAPITTPSYVPATVQYVPHTAPAASALPRPTAEPLQPPINVPIQHRNHGPTKSARRQRVPTKRKNGIKKVSDWTEKRVPLPRQAKSATILNRPYAYHVTPQSLDVPPRLQTAGLALGFTGESSESLQYDPVGLPSLALAPQQPTLSPWESTSEKSPRQVDFTPIHYPFIPNESIEHEADRFLRWVVDSARRPQRTRSTSLASTDREEPMPPASGSALVTASTADDTAVTPTNPLLRPMIKAKMTPVFPSGPLNLNDDGTEINYRKSHAGTYAEYWANADGEEIERLFTTGTMIPIFFNDIPADKIVTYVNPVCVEKQNDDGSLKFRTRLTIGGDRIAYPFDTTAVTAEMESLKILLNCMISEHANWSTLDLTDFYLGTDLPHPEYIRIPLRLIPENVIAFYNLQPFISGNALFCSVHKTHYGLPQAGALSQQRLFQHLRKNGYYPIPSSPSVFRNNTGTIRFTLVVDDFAVAWTNRDCMNHFVHTLTELYQVKVNWMGSKYLGMDIAINRKQQHVTLSMPGYIDKLLRRVCPDGIKSANTPAHYTPPNYSDPGAHKATVDASPPACESDKKYYKA
jgi:hypothetical protein